MHIKKQRLLTPGPTPLLPKALHAMMESDVHHRTEAFRQIYAAVLADLKEVFGTKNDVLCMVASGTGAMDASVSNLFSRGDKVIVCSAGKFGERWAQITKAYGLDATVITKEYGDFVTVAEVEETLGVCDRVLILYKGRIIREFQRGEATKADVMHWVAGGVQEETAAD